MSSDHNARFRDLRALVPCYALTVPAIARCTDLEFRIVTDVDLDNVTRFPGVYCWADKNSLAAVYVGSGTGATRGLAGRLAGEFRWERQAISAKLAPDPYGFVTEVPIIRSIVDLDLACHIAPVGDTGIDAGTWEVRIRELAAIVAGNRSILGGSAWEVRGRATDAQQWALERLVELQVLPPFAQAESLA